MLSKQGQNFSLDLALGLKFGLGLEDLASTSSIRPHLTSLVL